MLFVWDPDKAASNARKHDVAFEDAATAFADSLAVVLDDVTHADRTVIIDRATRHERTRYEEEAP